MDPEPISHGYALGLSLKVVLIDQLGFEMTMRNELLLANLVTEAEQYSHFISLPRAVVIYKSHARSYR